mmetsp:Transcript_8802/g.13573  ORF Transcript_8802/g.13573 Transcript_8802/m.13573 type:complete len:181 (+) Transcript_8802:30-572(+)
MNFSTLALLLGSVSAYEALEESELAFMNWVAKHGKAYGTREEYNFRLANFQKVYKEVQELNSMNLTSKHAVNSFSDWSDFERKKLLGDMEVHDDFKAETVKVPEDYKTCGGIDWVKMGKVTPVKDQGKCGSCWAFSAVGMIESAEAIKRNTSPDSYSEQQVLDCCDAHYGELGCSGGDKK